MSKKPTDNRDSGVDDFSLRRSSSFNEQEQSAQAQALPPIAESEPTASAQAPVPILESELSGHLTEILRGPPTVPPTPTSFPCPQ